MKFNSIPTIFKTSTTTIALLLMAGMHNIALADNATALKDAIKTDGTVAEVKSTEMKEIDSGKKSPADEQFSMLDANKDGKISLKESAKDKSLAAQFDVIDANRDGMVSAEEYASAKSASSSVSPTSAEAASSPSKY